MKIGQEFLVFCLFIISLYKMKVIFILYRRTKKIHFMMTDTCEEKREGG